MNIGLLLGSFDPPHIGHAYIAVEALDYVDEVWVIPAWQNPFKKGKSLPFEHRYNMTKLLFDTINNPKIIVDSVESAIKPDYSYELIKHLIKTTTSNYRFSIIGGYDIVENIHRWKQSDFILSVCGLVGINREKINISSTEIRALLNDNKETQPFLTKEVINYIKNKNLYNYGVFTS